MRIAEFFDAYGIDLDSEAALQEDADIYQGIAEMDGYETLLHLEMWGDYHYEETFSSVTYHFNDFDSPCPSIDVFSPGRKPYKYGKTHGTLTANNLNGA
ncbi:hypothetical protein AALA79_10890 [Lachnospiraceae bacterium 64-25]